MGFRSWGRHSSQGKCSYLCSDIRSCFPRQSPNNCLCEGKGHTKPMVLLRPLEGGGAPRGPGTRSGEGEEEVHAGRLHVRFEEAPGRRAARLCDKLTDRLVYLIQGTRLSFFSGGKSAASSAPESPPADTADSPGAALPGLVAQNQRELSEG
mmetsp:Transcript_35913/g.85189  ORF Transcript_35913/g.85189 Transcript_35913/m.85189 type:complete len:152 (+) Transcript_35913:330-785(+)